MKPLYLLFGLLLAPLGTFSQNAQIDSLRRVIETTRVDSIKARTLCRLCIEYKTIGALTAADSLAQLGYRLALKSKDPWGKAWCLNVWGTTLIDQGQFADALKKFEQSQPLWQQVGDEMRLAGCLINQAICYQNLGNFPASIERYQRGIRLAKRAGNRTFASNGLIGLAQVYSLTGDQHKSLQTLIQYGKSISPNDTLSQIRYRISVAVVYKELNEPEAAKEALREALELCRQPSHQTLLPSIYLNLSAVYMSLKAIDAAIEILKTCLALDDTFVSQVIRLRCLTNLADCLIHFRGDARQASGYAKQAVALAQLLGGAPDLAIAYAVSFKADSALGNWKSAYEAARLYHLYSDSLKNDEKSKELGRLEAQYEAEKERELLEARQQAKLTQRNWYLGSSLAGLVLTLLIAFTLFRSRRKEQRANATLRTLNQEIQMQKAEIEAQNSEITAQRDQLNTTNQRLVELDRMKEQLTGMIVHDLKNPLNAILGLAALPPDADRLKIVRGAGQQMSQLVLNLLDVQKYEEAALVLKPETHPAADLIRQAVEQTAFLAEQKQICFAQQTDPRLVVHADGELIVRVLVNLLTNAIKYAPAGDQIAIEASFEASQGAIFRVTDHGRGIPPDELGRVFDRFAQVGGGQASGQLRSTGLGLTFCRLTVEAHGGRIGVQSEVGQYTTFVFNLPQAQLTEDVAAQPAPAKADAPPPELTASYRAAHAEALATLATLPLYSVSNILDILDRMPETEAGVSAWKAALEAAALSGNEAAYRTLLNA